MNINFEKARNMMVENQLRPNKITEPLILNLFKNTKKENFLSEELKEISYSDLDINLDANRGYLKNLHIAQLIHNSFIKEQHKVLHIGGLTGYVSVMLASLCKELVVIENQKDFIRIIERNVKNLNINNLKIVNSTFQDGCIQESPYDIIFIDNPIEEISHFYEDQICDDEGKIIMIKKINTYLSKAYKITKNNNKFMHEFLFDVFTDYQLYKKSEVFVF